MKTNFFETLDSLKIEGDWKLTISRDEENRLVVSVLLTNEKCGDDARKIVPPMLFKGTPQELDEGFFASLITPAQQTASLFANMEQYLKELEKAKAESKMAEEKQKREKNEKEDRRKKYEAQIKKVTELEEKEKWGEAIASMPKTEDFPEQAEEIKKKVEELRSKHSALSLF